MIHKLIRFFLENRLFTILLALLLFGWGWMHAPFGNTSSWLPKSSIAVDAIPDIGENQQIVFTSWPGRSPKDIEDQITYPLTSALLGVAGVKSIRSSSLFGFSSIYLIFEEDIEFYWSRSRILEKLSSLPTSTLPEGVQPSLGPDATALGQIFWYTIEGRNEKGHTTGGWDLHELRSIQEFNVKYALNAVAGVAEVASIGGFLKEYQIDLLSEAMQARQVTLQEVIKAVKASNLDVGASTLEINSAEYFVRGLGYIKSLDDLEETVVKLNKASPVRLRDIAHISFGPAERRGILDKSGAEVVGGVVIARYGANPMEVIASVKEKIAEISPGLPKKELTDGNVSQLTISPFYDRSQLINETLGTLEVALTLEILITIIVVVLLVQNLRASILISSLLPLAILMVFIAMHYMEVDANIVSLSGIAIAIGTLVDLGIILTENLLKHLKAWQEENQQSRKLLLEVVYEASKEVSGAIITAVATTIISFIPVFTLQATEGKLFTPLAFTKTFALIAAVFITLVILPTFAYLLFKIAPYRKIIKYKPVFAYVSGIIGIILIFLHWIYAIPLWLGFLLLTLGINGIFAKNLEKRFTKYSKKVVDNSIIALMAAWLLAEKWTPLSVQTTGWIGFSWSNYLFTLSIIGIILGIFTLFYYVYPSLLKTILANKKAFLWLPSGLVVLGLVIWLGFETVFGNLANFTNKLGLNIRTASFYSSLHHTFPGVGEEFMPSLDEGAFLLMPTTMPHAGISENKQILQTLDMAVTAIPEVQSVVGKAGRIESALDPAPLSMFENIIQYKSEYLSDDSGERLRFKTDHNGNFFIKDEGDKVTLLEKALTLYVDVKQLIPDENGQYFRQWRPEITSPDDIWKEIVKVTRLPGVTSAPKLQPIETRLVMLQTGMRAPMGIKIKGPDLATIEAFGLALEKLLKQVPSVKADAVFSERIVGKPYLEIVINRKDAARYGLSIQAVQEIIETAIGGIPQTFTVEGRERFAIRLRYARELRNSPDVLQNILVPLPNGQNIPLGQITEIQYTQGPQAIKSEDTFLTGYVLFDKKDGFAEIEVVEAAGNYLKNNIESGQLKIPAGISYRFSGSYENQLRASKRLSIVIPICLMIILLILYFQFRSVSTSLMVFSGIAVAFSGAFILIWLYGTDWFLNIEFLGINFRELFHIKTIHLSVAVWVGFIALFGIATDDGVLIATYLQQSFQKRNPKNVKEIREAVLEGALKRVRPALMTSATTILALLPIITSTGRGSDIMIPMAIPTFGGMLVALITLFVVPVLYAWKAEIQLKKGEKNA
ncbi:MAG: efflux RND transporter permease subunit [Bacteroidota bacterium]